MMSIDIDEEFTGEASRKLLQQQHQAMADQGVAAGDAKNRGGLGKAAQAAAGKNTGGGQLGKDELIAQHPAMTVPHRSQEAMNNEDGRGENDGNATENAGAQAGNSNAQEVSTGASGSSDQPQAGGTGTGAPGGPEVLKTDAPSEDRVARITAHLNASTIDQKGGATDDDSMDDFRPHILHSKHDPVPIAMVNRRPKGSEFL